MHHRFVRAVADAEHYHRGQTRKATAIPYLSHVLSVAALVFEAGGTEDEAIAALLHDAAEDVNVPDATGRDVLAAVRLHYGRDVAAIVEACSDVLGAPGEAKPPWRARKQRYLDHLRTADASTLLVSAADKLHNLRAIAADRRAIGDAVWQRFSTGGDPRADSLWYYRSLLAVYVDPAAAADPRRARLTGEMELLLADL